MRIEANGIKSYQVCQRYKTEMREDTLISLLGQSTCILPNHVISPFSLIHSLGDIHEQFSGYDIGPRNQLASGIRQGRIQEIEKEVSNLTKHTMSTVLVKPPVLHYNSASAIPYFLPTFMNSRARGVYMILIMGGWGSIL